MCLYIDCYIIAASVIPKQKRKKDNPAYFASSDANSNGRERATEKEEQIGPPKTVFREYFESAVVIVIMTVLQVTFIVQAVKVPAVSMQNTITVGDHLLINKLIVAPGPRFPLLPQREIRRGDLLVFKYPANPFNRARDQMEDNIPFKVNYVKRVIGLPGDTVEMKGLQVFINGQALPEHVIVARNVNEKAPLEIIEETPRRSDEKYDVYYFEDTVEAARNGQRAGVSSDFHFAVNGKPAKVPDNSYFVMGDDRDNSLDSRAWGFVPRDLILGRAMFVYWSYDETQPFGSPIDFFANTRWRRTGTMVR